MVTDAEALDAVKVYNLMRIIWPKLDELDPLHNTDDAEDFAWIEKTARVILQAGYARGN